MNAARLSLAAAAAVSAAVQPASKPQAATATPQLMLVGHTHSFLGTLSFETLQRCRDIVKRTHMRFYPKELITDREADRIIEAQGPKCWEAAQRLVIEARARR